jgi:ABC-2 type transport system permease protein
VQWITYLDPLCPLLIVPRGVFVEGDTFGLLLDQYWPMAVIGLARLSAAGWLFRHRMV